MSSRNDNLGALGILLDLENIDLDPVVGSIGFTGDDLVERDNSVGLAELDIYAVLFRALNDSGEDFVFLLLILFENRALLRFTDALHDNLLCGLRCNPAEILCARFLLDHIAELEKRIDLTGIFERDLGVLILDLVNNGL